MKKLMIKFKEFILGLYYRLIWWQPIWLYILNGGGRRVFMDNLPKMDLAQARIVNDLKKNGIATSSLSEVFPGKNILPVLQEYAKGLREKANISGKKKFLLDLWETSPVLDFNQPFVRVSLSKKILEIVSFYFELCPKFYYYLLNVALPVSLGDQEVQSQRWHRDPEDKKMCKLFIYLNDVDDGTGPFFYIKGSHLGGKYRGIYPQAPPHGVYPPEGVVEKLVNPEEDIVKCVGKAGTVIFCDTSGLHKGGYATTKERIMFTAGFITKASRWKAQYKKPQDFNEKSEKLSPLVRFSLED